MRLKAGTDPDQGRVGNPPRSNPKQGNIPPGPSVQKPSRLLLAVMMSAAIVGGPSGNLSQARVAATEDPPGQLKTHKSDATPKGRWRRFREESVVGQQGNEPYTEEQLEEMRQLEALGYLDGVSPAPHVSGVTIHQSDRTWSGLNLLVSGHASEVILMDMNGTVLHKWAYDYRTAFPDKAHRKTTWRRAYLFEGGDLLAIWAGRAMVRLDKNSQLKWTYEGGPHHDIFVTPDGRIHVLSRKATVIPEIHKTQPVIEDFVDVLDENGERISRLSILSCFRNSAYYSPLLETLRERVSYRLATDRKYPGDILHTNTLQVLDGSLADISPMYRKGNLLVCLREPGIIAVIDPKNETVVWATSGLWRRQHDSTLLENGRMLIFDNKGNGGFSRVLEFDPFTHEVFWKFGGEPPNMFHSNTCGAVQRLQNGNTLMIESDNGRALEVARDGTVVWEFVSPYRAGENNELIATLYDLVRIPKDWNLEWLEN